jgi:hypothetical protein
MASTAILRTGTTNKAIYGLSVLVLVIGLRLASENTANLGYLVLAAYALFGRAQAIQALAMSWLITMINPGLAPESSLAAAGRYLVVFAAAGSVFTRSGFVSKPIVRPITALTLGLGGFFLVHSWFSSPMPDISVLKAVSWTLLVITLVAAWTDLIPIERHRLSDQLFAGLVIVLLVSLPLLLMPVGYLRNGTGFQGILNQPQAFGSTMALLGAWTVARLLGDKHPSLQLLSMAALCLVLVVLSEARTAGIALVLGVVIALVVILFFSNRKLGVVLPGLKSRSFQFMAFFALMGVIATGPIINAISTDFISKGQRANVSGLLDAYDQSRGFQIDNMMVNIRQDPWIGIGFGIASEPSLMEISRDPFLGLPIGASVEKGVMPLAVLEEVGIPGFMLAMFWLWIVLRRSARGGMAPLVIVLTILLINLGESTLFSPGGIGLLQLNVIGWAIASGADQKRVGRAVS